MPDEPEKKFKLPEPPSEEEVRQLVHQTRQGHPKAEAARKQDQKAKAEAKSQSEGMSAIAFGLKLGYSLTGPIILGFGIGWVIDHFAHTNWVFGVGTVLGMIVGFVLLIYLMMQQDPSPKK